MKLRLPLALLLLTLGLQGCFPLVATGVGVGITSTVDRRTYGTQIEDRTIETRLSNRIDDKFNKDARVFVSSYNRRVLLTGQAKTEGIKQECAQLARTLPNEVREVYNELTLDARPSFGTRSDDTLTMTKVKSRLLGSNDVNGLRVKITVESGVVYLMGMLTEREADAATSIASTTTGVSKVVRLFEIITPEQANQLDHPAGPAASVPAASEKP